MRSPHFDDLCADIRGFDLGDDERLLAELGPKLEANPGAVDHETWTFYGVLCYRTGDHVAANDAFERAGATGAPLGLVEFLRAHVLGELGHFDEALIALDTVAHASDEEEIAKADLLHARGALALAQGDTRRALESFLAGLEDDPHDAARWLQTARLLGDIGSHTDSAHAVARALAEDENAIEALYERASMSLRRPEQAAAELAELIEREPTLRERAVADPRWRSARASSAIAEVLSPPPLDVKWIPSAPPWLGALALQAEVAALGVQWLTRAQSEAISARLHRAFERGPSGTIHTPATLALCRERLATAIPVATGPVTLARDRTPSSMVWFFDRVQQRLRLAPSEAYPAFLWLDAGTDLGGMRHALDELLPAPFPGRLAMKKTVRGFIGYRLQFGVPSPYTGELEPANAHELDRHFALSPFVEAGAWGSAVVDDPWPELLPEQPGLQLKIAARERSVTAQGVGRVWSISRRTRHSRSIFTIELHHRDVFVAEVRYRPSKHTDIVARTNAHFGSDYPVDLPIDAVAALLGFRFDGARDLENELGRAKDGDAIAGLLQVLSALRHSDPAATALYRRWLEHPDECVRSTLYNIFIAHNHESLLEEACVVEPDAEIRAQIEGVLDEGIGPVAWDPYEDYELDDATAEESA
jgi:tetratricopeptide (TPR) repeat protein